ncbi:MAG: hypothetical protein ACSHWS_07720 [Sulfitobacter sp.]
MTGLPAPLDQIHLILAPLTGAAEHGLSSQPGSAQARAKWLLENCLQGVWHAGQPVTVADLTLSQFDACLAQLYRHLYGDQLVSQCTCTKCAEPFELRFDLADIQTRLNEESEGYQGASETEITAPSGRVFRLPRVSDLAALHRDGSEVWLQALLVDGPFDAEALQAEIAQAGPVLSQDIDAPCPDCAQVNQVRFDIADYLVQTVASEGAFLWREVHLIARQYHWTLTDIMSLSREVRRQLTGLIVSEAQHRTRLAS